MPIVADRLVLYEGSCAELTPTQFHKLVRHSSPSETETHACHLGACQITDEFVRALFKNGIRSVVFPRIAPVDGGNICVKDDAIVDRVQEDVLVCVQASAVSTRTQPLRIIVSQVRLEDKDLPDFAQHLSYCYRGAPYEERIYDFPGEQGGADTAMHLQIVLRPRNRLEMIRAQRPNRLFYKPDE